MNCFFALSGSDDDYHQMAQVLVRSALKNTGLALYCVYDGSSDEFVRWLELAGVTVLRWQVSFLDELIRYYNGERSIEFCRGTYLCMELPKILEAYAFRDEYILYVDADVMFTGPVPRATSPTPTLTRPVFPSTIHSVPVTPAAALVV